MDVTTGEFSVSVCKFCYNTERGTMEFMSNGEHGFEFGEVIGYFCSIDHANMWMKDEQNVRISGFDFMQELKQL